MFPALCLLLFLGQHGAAQIDYNTAGYGVDPMDYSRVGTSGWQFLKLPTNARSTAMGGIRAAAGYGDASAAFTNPASAADVKGTDVQFSSMKWVADIQYSGLSAVTNLGEWVCVGLNLAYLNYGDMVRTEIGEFNGQPGIVAVTEGLGTFSAHDLAIGLLYSRQITSQLQLGGTIRYIQEKLDDATMRPERGYRHTLLDGAGKPADLDAGQKLRAGLGIPRASKIVSPRRPRRSACRCSSYLARPMTSWNRPPIVFTARPPAEYVEPNDGLEKVNVGAEYFFFYNFYLRGGYRFNYDEETFSFGFGVEYSVADDVRLKADYAFADVGRFKSVHMFTIGFGF